MQITISDQCESIYAVAPQELETVSMWQTRNTDVGLTRRDKNILGSKLVGFILRALN